MAKQIIKVPDIGTDGSAEVVEVLIHAGDSIAIDDPLIVLETEKASVEVPSSHGGKVVNLLVKEGDQLKTGSPIAEIDDQSGADVQAGADTDGEETAEAIEAQDQAQEQTQEAPQAKESKQFTGEAKAPKSRGNAAKSESVVVSVPDIGGATDVEVIEIYVKPGDTVAEGDSLIVLESEKATLEVPSSHGGTIEDLLVKTGDKVKEGDKILRLAASGGAESEEPSADESGEAEAAPVPEKTAPSHKAVAEQKAPAQKGKGESVLVTIPDLGGASDVEVIEVYVKPGDTVAEGDSLIVLESEKASLEIPSSHSGTVEELLLNVGDKVKEGDKLLRLSSGGAESAPEPAREQPPEQKKTPQQKAEQESPNQAASKQPQPQTQALRPSGDGGAEGGVYAGPAVRKLARQLGINLNQVKSSGPRGRYTKDDLRRYVRELIADKGAGSAIPKVPAVDFSQFGEIKKEKLSKIKRLTATNMHRSWLNVPHVTQFDDADISDLEEYRKQQKVEAEKRQLKLTPLPFLLLACAKTLQAEPSFNVSIDSDGEYMIQKQYIHIGVAVDTPAGLLVPVIRDVDKKDIWQLAAETGELAKKARDGKLTPREMQGGCFTISSLGSIGGQGFTPIVNTPEVGILGVSKATIKPHWDGNGFVPRKMLPLSLSYDHRAVNGADAGRFLTHLVKLMGNVSDLV